MEVKLAILFSYELKTILLWDAVCAKTKIRVAFTFTVVIYEFHDGNLLNPTLCAP